MFLILVKKKLQAINTLSQIQKSKKKLLNETNKLPTVLNPNWFIIYEEESYVDEQKMNENMNVK